MTNLLSTNPTARKAIPLFSGCLKYFPDALCAVAACSKAGNDQHNPGTELHWDRSKSGDEMDALARHALGVGTLDEDGIRHSTKVAWRALANLQKEIESGVIEEVYEPINYSEALENLPATSSYFIHAAGFTVPSVFVEVGQNQICRFHRRDGTCWVFDYTPKDIEAFVSGQLWIPISRNEAFDLLDL
jgi:hypothetical protein